MRKLVLSMVFIGSALLATDTITTTTFTPTTYTEDNQYGESLYSTDVTIKTENFKIKNFWKKFSGAPDVSYYTIATRGSVQITAKGTSLCSLYPSKLNEDSCSGQKPFFINEGTINDNSLTSLVFTKEYNSTVNDSFFPIDVERNTKYYKITAEASSTYTFMGKLFSSFIGDNDDGRSRFFSTIFFRPTIIDTVEADIRQRYVANLVSGLDKEHRLAKAESTIKLSEVNNPVSMIDYSEEVSDPDSCGGSGNSLKTKIGKFFCNVPFLNWFVHTTEGKTYVEDTIEKDTEVALISFAGTNAKLSKEDVSYYETIEKDQYSSNPIKRMFQRFSCFFGGCKQSEYFVTAEQETRSYSEEDAMIMSIPVVNSSGIVTTFENVKLISIHSVVPQGLGCTFQKKGIFSWSDEVRVSEDYLYEKSSFFIFTRWKSKSSIGRKDRAWWLNTCNNKEEGNSFKLRYKKYRISEKVDTKARMLVIDVKRVDKEIMDVKNSTLTYKLMSIN